MLLFICGLFMGGFMGISIMSLVAIDRYEEKNSKERGNTSL